MIQLPKRSVTRFFIPLIDVMTLLFCIFLLMPMVNATGDGQDQAATGRNAELTAEERRELEQLRQQKRAWQDLERLRQEMAELRRQLEELRKEKLETLQNRLAIRVLEIGDEDGSLSYYDPRKTRDRRVKISADNVAGLIQQQKREAAGNELYFLILYPRPVSGDPQFPLKSQREEYDNWFKGVAHGYDIPVSAP